MRTPVSASSVVLLDYKLTYDRDIVLRRGEIDPLKGVVGKGHASRLFLLGRGFNHAARYCQISDSLVYDDRDQTRGAPDVCPAYRASLYRCSAAGKRLVSVTPAAAPLAKSTIGRPTAA